VTTTITKAHQSSFIGMMSCCSSENW